MICEVWKLIYGILAKIPFEKCSYAYVQGFRYTEKQLYM